MLLRHASPMCNLPTRLAIDKSRIRGSPSAKRRRRRLYQVRLGRAHPPRVHAAAEQGAVDLAPEQLPRRRVVGEDAEESEVRFTISDGVLDGYVLSKTGWWFVEPLRRFDPKAGPRLLMPARFTWQ